MKGSFRSNGSGSQAYNGAWQPHWGIDIKPYAPDGWCAILVRDDMKTSIINNTSTAKTIKIYGASGLLFQDDTITNNAAKRVNFDPSAYSDAFPDPNNINGYGTYILVFNFLAPQFRIDSINGQNGVLWWYGNQSTSNLYYLSYGITLNYWEAIELDNGYLNQLSTVNQQLIKASSVLGYINYSSNNPTFMFQNCNRITEVPAPPTTLIGSSTTYMAGWYTNCYSLRKIGFTAWVNNYITSLNATFQNCRSLEEAINITSTSLTNFGANNDMRSVPSITINAPLTLFVVNNAYSCKKLRVLNSNFKSLGSNTTVIDIRNIYSITEAELITFANNLEDLTGYVTKTISKAGTTNWTSAVTAILTAKNWTII